MHGKRKIKLRRVFESKFFDLIIIQLIEFYIINKHIYRREILIEKVNLINPNNKVKLLLVEKVNLILEESDVVNS
jgi:hypothetical protein